MSSSNLKSLVIKQNRNISETLNPAAFSYLYQAIKEIVDYWDDYSITEPQKTAYLNKYGLTNFIDISGAINVSYCYSNELSYICKQVNGSSTNLSNPLSINVTSGYYLNFTDDYWKAALEETFYKNKISGVIVTSQIDDNKGISTQDVLSYSFTTQKYTPGENDKIDYFFGVNKETFSTDRCFKSHQSDTSWQTNRKSTLANYFDYFLLPNDENNLANIKVMDFTPFARIIEKWNKWPVIITADKVYGPVACKRMDEFWLYSPSKGNKTFNPSNMMFGTDDSDGRSIFNGGAYMTTFKKMYIFCGQLNEGNIGHGYHTYPGGASYTQIFGATYFVADIGYLSGAIFAQGISTQFLILIDSKKLEPVVTPDTYSDQEAAEYFQNAVDNGIFTKWSWTKYSNDPLDYGGYIAWQSGDFGGYGDLTTIVVPDDRYYYYVYAPYVSEALGTAYYAIYDQKTINSQTQSVAARITSLKQKYKKYSEFMNTHASDFIDSETGKYWWQCNNSLNNVINALYPEDNNYGIYNI